MNNEIRLGDPVNPHMQVAKWAQCETPKALFECLLSKGNSSVNAANIDRVIQLLNSFFTKYEEEFFSSDISDLEKINTILRHVEPEEDIEAKFHRLVHILSENKLDTEEWSVKIATLIEKIQEIANNRLAGRIPEFPLNVFRNIVDFVPPEEIVTIQAFNEERYIRDPLFLHTIERVKKFRMEASYKIIKLSQDLANDYLAHPNESVHFERLYNFLLSASPGAQKRFFIVIYNGGANYGDYVEYIRKVLPDMLALTHLCPQHFLAKREWYEIGGGEFDPVEIQAIAKKLTRLKHLNVTLADATQKESLRIIANMKSLKYFESSIPISENKGVNEDAIRAFVDSPNKNNLETLVFLADGFNEECLRMLAQSPNFPKLKRIIVDPSFLGRGRPVLTELGSQLELIPYILDEHRL